MPDLIADHVRFPSLPFPILDSLTSAGPRGRPPALHRTAQHASEPHTPRRRGKGIPQARGGSTPPATGGSRAMSCLE